ncbi:sulfatase family protein [Rubinisphaera margarita]|uniref:sulfatase family protein n=1 Tax=Rubinisphaera margarita TaxID=2909586 RepID=UPI001EE8A5DB|nr:sulfatase [Rubinisphaera margarita]MCG6155495.1 sulfatase [Rubinisphaera margarita]
MKSIQWTCLLLLLLSGSVTAAERPNLVLIIADDCTYSDLGTYGGQAKTPNLDALAAEGMKFTQCFQSAPMCSPTRHNIYTGLFPVKSGAYPNHTFAKKGTKSIVHDLKPLGYRVHLSGKRHIGPVEVFPFEYSGKSNPDMQVINTLFQECKADEQPFCLIACSNEPHTPWNKGDASQYDPDELEFPPYLVGTPHVREQFTKYLAEITYFDSQIGEIVDLLEKHGLEDDTLVMVLSEQGNSLPFAKWTCYEAGVASGMVVRWPGRVKPGSETDAMVEYVDILPTFVEAAGGNIRKTLDGKSFLPVLQGERDDHKKVTYSLMTTRGINNGSEYYPIRSARNEQFRLIWNLSPDVTFQNACTESSEFKSMEQAAASGNEQARELTEKYQHRPEYELYDVVNDPHNMRNLAGEKEFDGEMASLRKSLEAWMADQGDEGIATEMAAGDHQNRGRKPAGKNARQKSRKNASSR